VAVRCCLVRGGRLRAPAPETDGDDAPVRLVYRFRFIPHEGEWRAVRAPRLGHQAVQPLLAYTVNDTWSEKSLPRSAALATVEASGAGDALLTCLKQSEDGEELIARWFEASGAPCGVRVEIPDGAAVTRVELQERPVGGGLSSGGAVATGPWEIVTVRV
jgi:alpha-mannosidase